MIVSIILVALFLACICVLGTKKRQLPLASGAWPIVGHTIKFIKSPKELYKLLLNYSMESIRCDEALTIRILGTNVYESIWRKHHKLLSPTFTQRVMDAYLPEINQQAKSLVFQLDAKAGKGKFDHIPYLQDTSLRSICSTAMGVITDDKDVKLREQYMEARTTYYYGLLLKAQRFWLHSEFMYNMSGLKNTQNDLGKTLRDLTNTVLSKRKADLNLTEFSDGKRVKPFMDHLLDMQRDGIFTDTEIQEEVDTFTLTGSDSVALTLAVALICIGTYPKIQRKISDELGIWITGLRILGLRLVFQGSLRDVEKQDLVQLKYLEAVIKETLRLFPIVPIVARTLDKDVKIRNYNLPAGSRCFVSLYGVNSEQTLLVGSRRRAVPSRAVDGFFQLVHKSLSFFWIWEATMFRSFNVSGIPYAMMSTKTMLAHVLRHYTVFGDVAELECEWSVMSRPLPRDYISIERNI